MPAQGTVRIDEVETTVVPTGEHSRPASSGAATHEATAEASGAVTGELTGAELERLANRLAGPILRRIRAEFLRDRERLGRRTDVW